jgi:hypothetical protein
MTHSEHTNSTWQLLSTAPLDGTIIRGKWANQETELVRYSQKRYTWDIAAPTEFISMGPGWVSANPNYKDACIDPPHEWKPL